MTLRSDRRRRSQTPGAIVAVPGPGEQAQPYRPAWLQAADHHTLPVSPSRLRATWDYLFDPWYRVPKALLILTGRGIRGCKRECMYTIEGGLRVVDKVYSFGAAIHYEQGVALALGSSHQYHAKARHINARRARGAVIWAAVGALCILGLWLGFYHRNAGVLAGVGLMVLLDAIGRHGRTPEEKPAKKPEPLQPGTPATIVWGQVNQFLAEEGLEHAITVYAVRPDPFQEAFHIDVTTFYDIDAKFLRALEKRLFVGHGCIALSTTPGNAADKTLTVRMRNPLANVPEAPWLPAGSVSAWQPLDLGRSAKAENPFELVLVMQHIIIVAGTRGGKTVHLSNIIDRLSATRDGIVCVGAIVKSAVFDAWRSIPYKKAENVDQMIAMLQWAIDEIHRRDLKLKEINSDDDPNNDVDKWNPTLGPAITIVLDEFREIISYDGTKVYRNGQKPNLLEMIESIICTGAGMGVNLILATQTSGNTSWGSSLIAKQTAIKIIGPCDESDTVDILGKDKRDKGYAPHLLHPAEGDKPNDAGMAVVDGPGFGSDYVRGYAPFKVKARALRREAEWAESGTRPMPPIEMQTPQLVMDAELVPPGLDIVIQAMKHHNDARILSSEMVLKYAKEHNELDPAGNPWTATNLGNALRAEVPGNEEGKILSTRNGWCEVLKKVRKSYHREDVDQAIKAIEGPP